MNKILDQKVLSRVRRNHGLEHATIHILSSRFPSVGFAGVSDPGGFWVTGNVDLDDLTAAVVDGLARLRAGERNLAIHPNCGTNFVTTGVIAGFVAWFSMLGIKKGWKEKLDRLPQVITLTTLAIMASQPIGYKLQATVTTDGNPGKLELSGIQVFERAGMTAYRVSTKG
jgi:hypothetical protein